MDALPPILILEHYKERRSKCSLKHLRGRPELHFRTVRPPFTARDLPLDSGLVLALDAPELSAADRRHFDRAPPPPLVVVDGTWRNVEGLLAAIVARAREAGAAGALACRSLPAGWRSAYPRRSKLYQDPAAGLASIEALAAALHVLGYEPGSLLEGYRWAGAFLEINRTRLDRRVGVPAT
jgi:pre-rRNA-processing protein TSR3